MGTPNRCVRRRMSWLMIAAAGVIVQSSMSRANDVSWVVDADGNWADEQNWSSGLAPQAGDDVTINRTAVAITTTFSGMLGLNSLLSNNNLVINNFGSLSVAQPSQVNGALFLQTGATFGGSAGLTISGPFTFGGVLAGAGKVTLAPTSITLINTSSPGGLQTTLENYGTIAWSSTTVDFLNGTLNNHNVVEASSGLTGNFGGTNAFNNLPGAVFDKTSAGMMTISVPFNNSGVVNVLGGSLVLSNASNSNTGTINVSPGATFAPATAYTNNGTINFNGSAGFSTVPFSNSGTVRVNAGTLSLNQGVNLNGGKIVVASGATVAFNDNYTAAAGSMITGGGGVSFGASVLSFAGSIGVTGPTNLSSVGVTFTGNQTFNGALNLTGGSTISGPADLTVNGPFTFSGTMSGSGKTTLSSTADTQAGFSGLLSRPMDNAGFFSLTGGSSFTMNGATFRNLAGGTFSLNNNSINFTNSTFTNSGTILSNGTSTVQFSNGGGSNVFNNAGTFFINGFGSFLPSIPFNNSGLLQIGGTANVTMNGGGSNTGSIIFASSGGAMSLPSSFNNAGVITFSNGGSLNNSVLSGFGSVNLLAGNLTASSSTLSSGQINLSAGTTLVFPSFGDVVTAPTVIAGAGGVTFGSSISTFGGTIMATGPISTSNTVTFTGNQTFSGAVSLSGGTFTGPADITIAGPFSFGGALSGAGATLLSPTSSSTFGSATIARPVDNAGFVMVQGTVTLNNANFRNLAGGTIVFPTGSTFSINNSTFTNAGVLELTSGPFFSASGSSVFNNSGTILVGSSFAPAMPFNNSGTVDTTTFTTLTVSTGGANTGSILFTLPGTLQASASFINSGTINFLNGGTIRSTIAGPGSIVASASTLTATAITLASGSINVAAGATLNFSGIVNPGASITGSGGVSFGGSVATFGGLLAATGPITIGNPVTFTGNQTLNGAVNLTLGGVISGPSDVSIGGTLGFNGGLMSGAGQTILLPGSETTIGVSSGTLSRTLNNFGTIDFSSTNTLSFSGGALNNSGAFNIEAGGQFGGSVDTNSFNNLATGVVNCSPPSGGTFTSAVPFSNSGAVNVFVGTLFLAGGGTNSGVINVYPSTALLVTPAFADIGTINLFPGSTYSGNIASAGVATVQSGTASLTGISTYSGTVSLEAGATAKISGSFNALPGFVIQGAGNVLFSASVNNTFAGMFANTGQVTVNGSLNVVGIPSLAKPLNLNGSLSIESPPANGMQTIRALLVSGYDGGAWDGAGINSASAHADSSHLRALGYGNAADLGFVSFGGSPVGADAVLVKFTYYGDSSLDGNVDLGNDFTLFLAGYLSGASSWELGDYNYDGKVDAVDFGLFIDSYKSLGGSMGDLAPVIEGAPLTTAQKAQLLSVVPEPDSVMLITAVFAGCSVIRRRRRKCAVFD
jgi:fibronectin-binding autotransporter adhesin